MKMSKLKTITRTVLSSKDIPEKVVLLTSIITNSDPESYVEHRIERRDERKPGFSYTSDLDNWIIKTYPELEGRTILIHINDEL